ncbi:Hypothetical protein LUCI_5182 [Lucifera butyrica]|uniref:Acyl-coa dehydrogenases signature 1 n=1 Tax=Lucifera butyrica TaxID=1351585 RepID=A0A498REF8_9FIRM|nr:acyl-CoA dehydrogenase family protein [Lucifera butyrica]VBB09884.1 Hypothetical protein LUCI_5182 [Lucifera butyrica]
MDCREKRDTDIVKKARDFCAACLEPLAGALDKESRFPAELVAPMAAAGFFGLPYPVEWGGGGYSSVTAQQVMREIAKVSAGVALTFHVHWMAVDTLLRFGSEMQKQKYLPAMLRGDKIAAYTISEPQAGSDAAAITAIAVRNGDGWLLRGTKYFCTNGGLADLYFVAFKTDPAAGGKGISLFIIEKGTPGFQIGPAAEKMGCRSSVTTSLLFQDCPVTAEQLVGKENEGFKAAMYGLTGGRLGMASMGLGIAEAALEAAVRYANQRLAFGKSLSALYAIQEMIADMYIKTEAARLMVAGAAGKRDSGEDYSLESSMAKLFVADVAAEVCHKAQQIFGGHGYMRHNTVERYARDARLLSIGVGTSEVLKMVVGNLVAKSMA